MPYIHELPSWPNLTWCDGELLPLLAQVRYQQGRLLGQMDGLGFALREQAALLTLTSDVTQSSAIEGERLDRDEVRSSIARRLGIEFAATKPASRGVEGLVEVMLDATQKFAEPLTAERLFAWHAALFPTARSGMRRITVGAWRPREAGPMQVVSGPLGRERVHYEAPDAERLPSEMQHFLKWFAEPAGVDPVLKAGVAHLWFITVHPFEDGNGRIARAITDMSLARSEHAPERFYSMSAQLETERQAYYLQLESSQRGTTDITAWLRWFLGCLSRTIGGAETVLASVLGKARAWERINEAPVNERQRLVLNRLLDGFTGNLTTSKYAKLAKCSPDTALRDVQALVKRGVLVQAPGGGRSTAYDLAKL